MRNKKFKASKNNRRNVMNFDNVKKDASTLTSGIGNLLTSLGGIAAGFLAAKQTNNFSFVDDMLAEVGVKSDMLKKAITVLMAGAAAGLITGYLGKMKNKFVRLAFQFLSFFFWTVAGLTAFRLLMGLVKGTGA
jgi:hypothetical protein